jgi:hypothetical protein
MLRNIERITRGFNNNKITVPLFLENEGAIDRLLSTGLIIKFIRPKFHLTWYA